MYAGGDPLFTALLAATTGSGPGKEAIVWATPLTAANRPGPAGRGQRTEVAGSVGLGYRPVQSLQWVRTPLRCKAHRCPWAGSRRRRAGLPGVNRAWLSRSTPPPGRVTRVAGSFSRISSHLSSTNKLTVETAFFVFNYRMPRVILVTIVSHCKPELEGMHTGSGIPRSSGCLL